MDMILDELKKDLVALIKSELTFNRDKGEYQQTLYPDELEFKGVVLPLSTRDTKQMEVTEGGIYSISDKKLYTDKDFAVNTTVKDDEDKYNIYAKKNYDIADSGFKLYYMKRIDKID